MVNCNHWSWGCEGLKLRWIWFWIWIFWLQSFCEWEQAQVPPLASLSGLSPSIFTECLRWSQSEQWHGSVSLLSDGTNLLPKPTLTWGNKHKNGLTCLCSLQTLAKETRLLLRDLEMDGILRSFYNSCLFFFKHIYAVNVCSLRFDLQVVVFFYDCQWNVPPPSPSAELLSP